MIVVTPAALAHLRALLSNQPGGPEGLRILVEKGGCAGMQYSMKLDTFKEGDLLGGNDEARVFMDPATAAMLRGGELDYCDDLVGTGFRLRNPNAARSCGCGTSFEPAQQDAPSDSGPQPEEAVSQSTASLAG
jgi:iron-sulfur cluster assembly accessory protein